MSIGIIYAILAAFSFGLWTVFHQQASTNIHNLLGSVVVSLTAVIVGLLFLTPQLKSVTYTRRGLVFAILGGICALGIDYFALKSYSSGLSISVSAPIIIGGSIAVASVIGFTMGESITSIKVLSLLLILIGSALLAAQAN